MLQATAWWVLAEVLGLAALPLAATAFRGLPGKGFAYAKPLGVLLAAWLYWVLFAGIVGHGTGGVVVAAGVLAVTVWGWWWRTRRSGRAAAPLLPERRVVLAVELAFAAAFLVVLMLRGADAAILGGEKPSEFAMLNTTLASQQFPPTDAWLAGFRLNYYYLGYVVTAVFTHLTGATSGVAFTLGLPLAFALAAAAAFGLGYDLVALRGAGLDAAGGGPANGAGRPGRPDAAPADDTGSAHPASDRSRLPPERPFLTGAFSALVLLLAGNLEVLVEGVRAVSAGAGRALGAWLGLTAFEPSFASDFWFPDPSRWWLRAPLVLKDRGIAGDVRPLSTEFPFYDALIGDLHAPVLMLPFALLTVALAMAVLVARRGAGPAHGLEAGSGASGGVGPVAPPAPAGDVGPATQPWLAGGLLALALGAVWAGNAWYLPPLGFVAAAVWAFPRASEAESRPEPVLAVLRGLARSALAGLVLLVAAWTLFLPFHLSFRAPVAGAHWTFFEPTAFRQLVVELGPLLAAAAVTLAVAHRERPVPLRRPVAWLALVTVAAPIVVLGMALAATLRGVAATQGAAYLPLVAENVGALLGRRVMAGGTYLLLTVGLAWAVVLAVAHGARGSAARAFAALVAAAALLCLLAPELGFLDDGQGWRFNMVLKFHFAAWVLLAPVAGWGLAEAVGLVRAPAPTIPANSDGAQAPTIPANSTRTPAPTIPANRAPGTVNRLSSLRALALPALAWAALAGGVLAAAYPLAASWSHLRASDGWTVDGARGYRARHAADARALAWLCEAAPAGTVIVEAVGQAFSDGGRISAATGLPTVLGWPGHQRTYRGAGIMPEVNRRRDDVARIYTTRDGRVLRELLRRYDVGLLYLGRLERRAYPAAGDSLGALTTLPVAYDDGVVRVLRGTAELGDGGALPCRATP